MGKIIVTEFVSLDGVMENPAWTFQYWNDDIAKFKGEETTEDTALLLGRVTYQGFAAAWPQSKDEGAAYFNGVRKYVVSTTLEDVEWNNSRLIQGDVVAEIARLKREESDDLVVHGSATLLQTLMEHHLVDRYRLLVYPLVLGAGKRLFAEGTPAALTLVESRPLGGGVVALIYEPEGG